MFPPCELVRKCIKFFEFFLITYIIIYALVYMCIEHFYGFLEQLIYIDTLL